MRSTRMIFKHLVLTCIVFLLFSGFAVTQGNDIQVNAFGDRLEVGPGGMVRFTSTVRNTSDNPLEDAFLTVDLFEGFEFTDGIQNPSPTPDYSEPGFTIWNFGTIPPWGERTVTFDISVFEWTPELSRVFLAFFGSGFHQSEQIWQQVPHNLYVMEIPWNGTKWGLPHTKDALEDPVDAATGEYYIFPRLDFFLGGPLPVGLTRYYASNLRAQRGVGSALGPNWVHNFDLALIPRYHAFDTSWDDFTVVYDYGKLIEFTHYTEDAELWQLNFHQEPIQYQLKNDQDDGTGHFWLLDPIKEQVYRFDEYGDLVEIRDRNGNLLTLTRNLPGWVDQVTDGLGRNLQFTYNINDELIQVSDGTRQVRYGYDGSGTLVSVTDAMNNQTQYAYVDIKQNGPLLTHVTLPRGNVPYTQTYSGSREVIEQMDAYGNAVTMQYHTPSQGQTQVTDTLAVQEYDHEDFRLCKAVTDRVGNTRNLTYDDRHRKVGVEDFQGNFFYYGYHDATGKIASITNTKGRTISYTYTVQEQSFTNPETQDTVTFPFYDMTRIDYPDGTDEAFLYDATGNVLSRTDRADKIWNYTYDQQGQLLTSVTPTAGVFTYTYNADGTMASSRDSDTGITTYMYDPLKRLNKVTYPDGAFLEFEYDLNDRIISTRDKKDHVYTYDYDANGNLLTILKPDGQTVAYTYDLMDRVTEFSDELNKTTTYAYDSMGWMESFIDPNSFQISLGWDPRGWLNQTTYGGQNWERNHTDEGLVSESRTPFGNSISYRYDELGFVTEFDDPLNHTTMISRNLMNQITSVSDPLGRTSQYFYDERGRLIGVSTPEKGQAAYSRNDMGFINQVTDLNGQNWNFTYTDMGRSLSDADPLGNAAEYAYDDNGRLQQTTFSDAHTINQTYDDAGNLSTVSCSDGTLLAYTYDEVDRLIGANGLAFTRDERGWIVDSTTAVGAFGVGYDDGGRIFEADYGDKAFTVTYAYDAVTGLLSRVSDSLTGTIVDLTYDIDSRLTGIIRSNGVNAVITLDAAGRITRMQEGSFIDLNYTFNDANEITWLDMTVPLDPSSVLNTGEDIFTYNAASQVAAGGYGYDGRGRRITGPDHTFTWNDVSRLTGINNVAFTYNGFGDLESRTEGTTTIQYGYNYGLGGRPLIAERDGAKGEFLRYYVWTPNGLLLYMIDAADGNNVYFYHFDHLGSTLALTDAQGNVTDSYAYSPYGQILRHEGANPQPFTYLGMRGVRQEGSSGALLQIRYRYYDAATAGFLSRDPIWPGIDDPRGLNPYQYAYNDPVNLIDVTGLFPMEMDEFDFHGDPNWRRNNFYIHDKVHFGKLSGSGSIFDINRVSFYVSDTAIFGKMTAIAGFRYEKEYGRRTPNWFFSGKTISSIKEKPGNVMSNKWCWLNTDPAPQTDPISYAQILKALNFSGSFLPKRNLNNLTIRAEIFREDDMKAASDPGCHLALCGKPIPIKDFNRMSGACPAKSSGKAGKPGNINSFTFVGNRTQKLGFVYLPWHGSNPAKFNKNGGTKKSINSYSYMGHGTQPMAYLPR